MSSENQNNPHVLDGGLGWLAVDKPSGLSVHNDPGIDLISRIRAELETNSQLRNLCAWSPDFPPAPAHRLDRETSGICLLATSRPSATDLSRAFEGRAVEKIYRAVIRGRLAEIEGVWNAPLTDRAEGRKNPAGPRADRKPSETRFR